MAISFVAYADDHDTATSLSPAIPTGTAENDLMVAFCFAGQASGNTWDDDGGDGNGWTRLVNNSETTGRDTEGAIFYKIAGSSESAPTFT